MTNRESMMPSNKQVEISYQATRPGKLRNKGSMHACMHTTFANKVTCMETILTNRDERIRNVIKTGKLVVVSIWDYT